MKMKGYSLHAVNNLCYEKLEYPKCESGWCVVKVKAAGICSSDIPRVYMKGTYHFPTVPGHEFSGVVDKVADKGNEYLVGKKVGIFPLIPCRKCEQCQNGHYEMCANYEYVGSRRDGGFAEYVAVPVWNLIELSDEISFEEAAMMEPLAVALHAMKKADIKNNDTVAIIGTGMIAFAAAQWARKLGATKVVVIGRSESKRKIANNIPEIEYITFKDCEKEFDVVLEAVGSNSAIDKAINTVKAGGRLVLMGNPEGEIDLKQNTYWRILRKQLHITGTWNSSYEKNRDCDWSEVKKALERHEIRASALISHFYNQDDLKLGMELMHKHMEPYCKVMTLWNRGE